MTSSLHPLVDQLVEICAARGVHDWILAPGSRSAPLTVALTRHPAMRCRLIFDERAAAYVALWDEDAAAANDSVRLLP